MPAASSQIRCQGASLNTSAAQHPHDAAIYRPTDENESRHKERYPNEHPDQKRIGEWFAFVGRRKASPVVENDGHDTSDSTRLVDPVSPCQT